MSEILRTYESESTPGKLYHIIRGNDGIVYCDCWVWKKTRNCKHLKHYQFNPLEELKRPLSFEEEIKQKVEKLLS